MARVRRGETRNSEGPYSRYGVYSSASEDHDLATLAYHKECMMTPMELDRANAEFRYLLEQQAKEIARLREDLDCAERALILLRAERIKEHS